jgi:glucose-6-phosphate-specific signal transduction histidine kinase
MHCALEQGSKTVSSLQLHQAGERLTLEVRNDGKGVDATASFSGHLGLHSLRRRVINLSGTFQIERGQGTVIGISLPMCGVFQGEYCVFSVCHSLAERAQHERERQTTR